MWVTQACLAETQRKSDIGGLQKPFDFGFRDQLRRQLLECSRKRQLLRGIDQKIIGPDKEMEERLDRAELVGLGG